jgi:hypothetical protein
MEKTMADDAAKKPKLEVVSPPGDALDLSDLWCDTTLGDGLTGAQWHSVAVGKPRDFFRVPPDLKWRRRVEVYTHKPEGAIEEQHFIVHKRMWGRIDEARPALLVTCVYRDGSPRLWPLKSPKAGEKDNDAWTSARAAARAAMSNWVRLVWVRRAYQTREAQPGYAPEPDLSALPSFDQLVTLAFGAQGIIADPSHFILRELMGAAPQAAGDDDDSDDNL